MRDSEFYSLFALTAAAFVAALLFAEDHVNVLLDAGWVLARISHHADWIGARDGRAGVRRACGDFRDLSEAATDAFSVVRRHFFARCAARRVSSEATRRLGKRADVTPEQAGGSSDEDSRRLAQRPAGMGSFGRARTRPAAR